MKKINIKTITAIAVMCALTCIVSPFSIPIPISPVPIALTPLVIFLSVYLLGWKKGTLSCIIYILIGLIGLPIFSGFTGGAAKLIGPTGGYIIGYIPMAIAAGIIIQKYNSNRIICFLGMLLGIAICYLFGTAWLAVQAHMDFYAALLAGVIPYIPGDIVKIIIVLLVAPPIKNALSKSDIQL